MNLFVPSPCPEQSARGLDDKRVGKLLMEACQMMSLAVRSTGGDYPFLTNGVAYMNHPVSIWVRASQDNYDWTWEHAIWLREEYESAYGRIHASAERLPGLRSVRRCLPAGPLLPFQNSARNGQFDFTYLPVPKSYRHYLLSRWRHDKRPVTFNNREIPSWVPTYFFESATRQCA